MSVKSREVTCTCTSEKSFIGDERGCPQCQAISERSPFLQYRVIKSLLSVSEDLRLQAVFTYSHKSKALLGYTEAKMRALKNEGKRWNRYTRLLCLSRFSELALKPNRSVAGSRPILNKYDTHKTIDIFQKL